MTPLDLTKQPPRSPRAPLGHLDLVMAARTVDKIRATLPGGNIVFHSKEMGSYAGMVGEGGAYEVAGVPLLPNA